MTAPIVILSDYGMGAGTAAVKGVCKTFAPQSRVFELSSDIPALNLDAAADVLCAGMQAWPEGTIFLNLVDNGEKGRRQAVVATKDGYIVVSPDNKVLAAVEAAHGTAEKRNVSDLAACYGAEYEKTALCHGRDLAYVAAKAAAKEL